MKDQYKIIKAITIELLEKEVNKFLYNGWQLSGGVTYVQIRETIASTTVDMSYFIQALKIDINE